MSLPPNTPSVRYPALPIFSIRFNIVGVALEEIRENVGAKIGEQILNKQN